MTDDILNADRMAARLLQDIELSADVLRLKLGACRIDLRSNSAQLLNELGDYFAHVRVDSGDDADMSIIAVEQEVLDSGLSFIDWKREPGKTGRKDAYCELADARMVLKVRTGMLFLQSENHRMAVGPCRQYDNQVINFVNAQYMNWLQQRDYLICHAAALVHGGSALGIAGFSGGGKSTLMLRLLDRDSVAYLTNDRLFIRAEEAGVEALGIAKLPRINPGTIVHNPRLQDLIPADERARLLALPAEELWHLEDKYDVDVARVYGPERILQQAPLGGFVVINWQRDSREPVRVEQVDLQQRSELLGAIMKSPGPFYQYADGSFFQDTTELEAQPYLRVLSDVPVYEVSGGVDFDVAVDRLLQLV